jgi:hypothetical protein
LHRFTPSSSALLGLVFLGFVPVDDFSSEDEVPLLGVMMINGRPLRAGGEVDDPSTRIVGARETSADDAVRDREALHGSGVDGDRPRLRAGM